DPARRDPAPHSAPQTLQATGHWPCHYPDRFGRRRRKNCRKPARSSNNPHLFKLPARNRSGLAVYNEAGDCPVLKIGFAKPIAFGYSTAPRNRGNPVRRLRRGVRAAEGGRLESVYTLFAYRGFESRPLRQINEKGPAETLGLSISTASAR